MLCDSHAGSGHVSRFWGTCRYIQGSRRSLLHNLLQARRLGVPVLSVEAAIEALIAGQPLTLQRPAGSPTSAEAGEERGGGGEAAAAPAAAEGGFKGNGEAAGALVEDSESLGRAEGQRGRRLSTDSVSLGRPAGAPKPMPQSALAY